MYDEIFGGNVENENDNKTEIKNETAEAAAAPSDDTVYDSASDTNSYEYSYNNTVADKNENDGSYHHSYINPDTYNPNRNIHTTAITFKIHLLFANFFRILKKSSLVIRLEKIV